MRRNLLGGLRSALTEGLDRGDIAWSTLPLSPVIGEWQRFNNDNGYGYRLEGSVEGRYQIDPVVSGPGIY